ncbi:RNA-directed DNA polymerase (Reverse transcriptase) [Trifolium medium]|uniref:RNA-directed DNA polymerase (Reverse transcriptase) n=1 Tax=Trifolium medium TaxID=97028 RepID=A0A392MWN2_9FABA|nr:RNA-directed DNA polymerase (Reverse transcriptase) [Trifolium medium]
MWISHPDCVNVVQQSWNVKVVGCPMYVISEKLKILKNNLKIWNKNVFGNIHETVKLSRIKVDEIQALLDSNGPSDALLDQEKLAQVNLENALHMEELFWHEKSKVKWHCEGDRNTAYFHKMAKFKQATSQISSIRNGDISLIEPDEVKAHIVNHFTTLFNAPDPDRDNGLVNEVIPSLITDRVNSMLTRLPTSEEIKNALFSLNKDSAPGPDGFGAIFFQTFWSIIKLDVINAVMQFFTSGWIMPNFNSNTLVLIPKTDNADSVNDYRPIAIANFKFKLISKIIADRLASIMPAITSIQQRGFIKGRSIKDCICLTSEAINVMQNRSFGEF